jgi:hypothetical protein
MDVISIYIDVQICMFSYILQLICLSTYFFEYKCNIYKKLYVYITDASLPTLPTLSGNTASKARCLFSQTRTEIPLQAPP